MNRPESPNGQNPDEFGFEWVEDDELSPEAQKLLEEFSVPVGKVQKQLGEAIYQELATDVKDRLATLRVDGYDLVDKRWITKTPELAMNPQLLDDVHYEIYRAKKKQPYNRFVSIKAEEVFEELIRLKEARSSGVLMQRKQNEEASSYLSFEMKMDEVSVYEAISKGAEGAFAVRSLHRLMLEPCMEEFRKVIHKAADRRADEAPLNFEVVSDRAVKWVTRVQRFVSESDPSGLSSDQQMLRLLELRDVDRSLAFTKPVINYIYQQNDSAQAD